MLTFTQVASRVASRLNKNINDTTVATRIKNHINDVCLDKWNAYAWSFRYREYPLVLSPQVTSGTLTATNGSQTVTASGTPFLSANHVGAWLNFVQDTTQAWYRVLAVNSTSSITIEPAYQGTSGGSKTYYLCPSDYVLPTELQDVGSVKITVNNIPLPISPRYSSYYQPGNSVGTPAGVFVFNQSASLSSYSTGTVSGTVSTTTLTGVNTAWLTSLVPGDEIVINGDANTYKVQQVNSDTSLTLYNFLVATATTASYSASRQFGRVLRFAPCADKAYVSFISGLRSYSPLINNSDTNELLVRYPHAVIEGAVWREASSSPDPREDSLYQKSEMLWSKAQGEDEAMQPRENFNPIFNPRQVR